MSFYKLIYNELVNENTLLQLMLALTSINEK